MCQRVERLHHEASPGARGDTVTFVQDVCQGALHHVRGTQGVISSQQANFEPVAVDRCDLDPGSYTMSAVSVSPEPFSKAARL